MFIVVVGIVVEYGGVIELVVVVEIEEGEFVFGLVWFGVDCFLILGV